MDDFLLLANKQSADDTRMVLISKRHISEVRALGNPRTDGAVVVMTNGHEVRTAVAFDNLVQELRGLSA